MKRDNKHKPRLVPIRDGEALHDGKEVTEP
jgi:hypothetical protein